MAKKVTIGLPLGLLLSYLWTDCLETSINAHVEYGTNFTFFYNM